MHLASLYCEVLGVTTVVNWGDLRCESGVGGEREWTTSLWEQCISSYTTSVLVYTCANPTEKDLQDVRDLTAQLVALPCPPDVWRSSMGSLDIAIRQGIVEGGKWYEDDRLAERRLERVGGGVAFLQEDNRLMPYRQFSLDIDIDVESMCLCLQSLLGVQFKAVSAVLASPESAAGGWLRKVALTREVRRSESRSKKQRNPSIFLLNHFPQHQPKSWLARTLTLARFKAESEMRRKNRLSR